MSKLNLVKPQGVVLTLGDKDYNVVYDFNAFAALERDFGDIQSAFNSLSGTPKIADMLKVLKAGLNSNEEVPSDKELGSYITLQNVQSLIGLINEALGVAMPEEKGKKTTKN